MSSIKKWTCSFCGSENTLSPKNNRCARCGQDRSLSLESFPVFFALTDAQIQQYEKKKVVKKTVPAAAAAPAAATASSAAAAEASAAVVIPLSKAASRPEQDPAALRSAYYEGLEASERAAREKYEQEHASRLALTARLEEERKAREEERQVREAQRRAWEAEQRAREAQEQALAAEQRAREKAETELRKLKESSSGWNSGSSGEYTLRSSPDQVLPYPARSPKNRWLALVLCVFLGFIGVHYFYVGRFKKGILYVLTLGLFYIGWLIDILVILFGYFKDSDGLYLK